MTDERFELMSRLEERHWWFRAKRELLGTELSRQLRRTGPLVDVGCGTGALVAALANREVGIGIDVSTRALELAGAKHPDVRFIAATADRLPIRDAAAAVVTAADVIEHLDDDVEALEEFMRITHPDGLIAIVVPAYTWAWSDHDAQLGHRRRYSRRSLLSVMEKAGIEVLRSTYFHSWLVPIAFLMRKTPLRYLMRGTAEEASFGSPVVNSALARLTDLERLALRYLDMPFGLSILAIGRRPSAARTP